MILQSEENEGRGHLEISSFICLVTCLPESHRNTWSSPASPSVCMWYPLFTRFSSIEALWNKLSTSWLWAVIVSEPGEKGTGRICVVFYNFVLALTWHHKCHILLVKVITKAHPDSTVGNISPTS